MFIGAPPAFVRPGRDGPGTHCASLALRAALYRRKILGAKLRREAQGRAARLVSTTIMRPMPDRAQGLSAVGGSFWPEQISEPITFPL